MMTFEQSRRGVQHSQHVSIEAAGGFHGDGITFRATSVLHIRCPLYIRATLYGVRSEKLISYYFAFFDKWKILACVKPV